MRKLFFICFIFLCCGSAAHAQAPQAVFSEANELYRQKSYTSAAARYQQLIDQGYQQKELYYNAGNAYYKAGHIGAAVYNYEKALQLAPRDEATLHNLDIVNQQIPNNPDALPLLFFQQWWQVFSQLFSANGWAVAAIVCAWLLVAVVIVYFFLPGRRSKWAKAGMYVTGVLLVITFGMAAAAYAAHFNKDEAIVMNAAVKAKAAPDAGSKDMFELQEGMKVAVLDHTREFCKVQLVDGKTGWVTCDNIQLL
ncbi:MAG TPA: SH3 domain-containing protein [Chitinophaga sp.]